MISRKTVCTKIDDAERSFLRCWNVLDQLQSASMESFFDFQPTLARAIYGLGKLHHELARERRSIVEKKKLLNSKWLRNRLKTIREYQTALLTTIAIGKRIGDYFSWIFYHHDRTTLIAHAQHPQIGVPSDGIGSLGEMNLAIKVQRKGSFFFLHHGITSILRLGDVSIIDLSNLKLVGIGEFKSRKESDTELSVSMILAVANRELMKKYVDEMNNGKRKKPISFNRVLDSKTIEKLGRQMKKIDNSLKQEEPDKQMATKVESNIEQFKSLFLKENQATCGPVGESQVMLAVPNLKKKLSARLLIESPLKDELLQEMGNHIAALVSGSKMENNHLFFGRRFNPVHNSQTPSHLLPLFWRGIKNEVVRKITFHEVELFATLNTGPIFNALNKLGFSTKVVSGQIHVKHVERNFEIENFIFFFNLISEGFLSENSVVGLLEKLLRQLESVRISQPTKVVFDIREVFPSEMQTFD